MFWLLLHERRRRLFILIATVALAAVFLFVLLPISRRADKLNEPLDKAWHKLAAALNQTNNLSIDFVGITNQLEATRQAFGALAQARQQARARADFGDTVRERLNAPFQLVDYESERGALQDYFRKLAEQSKVTIAPVVFESFPVHTADLRQPDLLWAELGMIENLLTTAIRCKVSSIVSLQPATAFTNGPSARGPPREITASPTPAAGPVGISRAEWSLAEIPVRIEFTGPAAAVANFLQSLPRRADEMKAAELPEALPQKPAMLLDRVILRKQAPERPDEVFASLRVVGFVFRE
jgi:hypothetical protein